VGYGESRVWEKNEPDAGGKRRESAGLVHPRKKKDRSDAGIRVRGPRKKTSEPRIEEKVRARADQTRRATAGGRKEKGEAGGG